LARFKEWIECEDEALAAYANWLLKDHSNNPDLGIKFSRSSEGRGFWWCNSWTTWEKPYVIMDRVQQRCVMLLENIQTFYYFGYGMSRVA
jgi:hypothetical protein